MHINKVNVSTSTKTWNSLQLEGHNEKIEDPMDIENINDDDTNVCNDNMLNIYLNGKQNWTS